MTDKEAIEAIAKILILPADRPDYIVLAVKELWKEHCNRNSRWCSWCESIRSPGETSCLDCDRETEEIVI